MSVLDDSSSTGEGNPQKRMKLTQGIDVNARGTERVWLKIFETAPVQMLNARGIAKYVTMDDKQLWECMNKPLKSGGKYMTEYASEAEERRGIAINRWLKSVEDYLQYQLSEMGMKNNAFVMKEAVYKEFYDEIKQILPSVSYCLAPKKVSQKSGAASLRSAIVVSAPVSEKDEVKLGEHGAILYKWLDSNVASRVRMMLQYQACGGLPFVAQCHHRCTQCFRYHGASDHSNGARSEVSLTEWQACIKIRHSLEPTGIGEQGDTIDFQ